MSFSMLELMLRENLLEFFISIMPQKGELTVILARKAYDLFTAFRKKFPDKFHNYQASNIDPGVGCLIHDRNMAIWLAAHSKSLPSKIKLVDDTLLHGNAMHKCLNLLKALGYEGEIEAFVFALNEQLTDEAYVSQINGSENSDRPLFFIKDEVKVNDLLTRATLLTEYNFSEKTDSLTVYFCRKVSRMWIKRYARQFLEVIHSESVPYVVTFPVFSMSFSEAAELLFKLNEFPSCENLLSAFSNSSIADKIETVIDSTIDCEKSYNVRSFCVMLNDVKPFEQYSILRVYANYDMKKVLIIPYINLLAYTSTVVDLKSCPDIPGCIRQLMHPDNGNSELQEENHSSLLRLIRYNRAFEVIGEVFGEAIYKYQDKMGFLSNWFKNHPLKHDEIKSFLENDNVFDWNPTTSEVNAIAGEDAIDALTKYQIPDYYKENGSIHTQSFDLYFDAMSNEYHRTKGVPMIVFRDVISKYMMDNGILSPQRAYMLADAFLIKVFDRGVGIPGANSKKMHNNKFSVGSRIRDGEMCTDAFARIPELFVLPWAVSVIKNSVSNEWPELKPQIKTDILNSFSHRPELTVFINYFFNENEVADCEIEDYITQHHSLYFFEQGESLPEHKLLDNIIVRYHRPDQQFIL